MTKSKRICIKWACLLPDFTDQECYIGNNPGNSFSIKELCRVAEPPEQTLHFGFKERFAVSPKAYNQMMQLNGIRQELLLNNVGRTVTEIATDWPVTITDVFPGSNNRTFGELAK